MKEPAAQRPAEQLSASPETPEDVAILFSWANLHGAKYRDFSASRREFRAQQRARIADQQRDAELTAARNLEQTAQRELEEAQLLLDDAQPAAQAVAADAQDKKRAEEAFRRAEERAQQEKLEAQRREQSAEELRVLAEKARSEMLQARERAKDQAARYAQLNAQSAREPANRPTGAIPGELADPYYYTGQVDPAYFAPTPGVRTAQAARISTQRKAYEFPMHPGSDEFDAGTVGSYRPDTTFAPSPSPDDRPAPSSPFPKLTTHVVHRQDQSRDRAFPIRYGDAVPPDPSAHPHERARGAPLTRGSMFDQGGADRRDSPRDVHIRPAMRRVSDYHLPYESACPANVFAPAPRRRASDLLQSGLGPDATEHVSPPPTEAVGRVPAPAHGQASSFSGQAIIPPGTDDQASMPKAEMDAASTPAEVAAFASARSLDRHSRSLRRRRDSLDKVARTQRQPRPETPLPSDDAFQGSSSAPSIPPAWFVASEAHDMAQPSEPAFSTASLHGTPRAADGLDTSASHTVSTGALYPQNAAAQNANLSFAIRQILDSEARSRRTSHAVEPTIDRASQLSASADTFAAQQNGIAPPNPYPERKPASQPANPAVATRVNSLDSLGEHRVQPLAETRSEAMSTLPIAPDTLQQSRERVAQRWFALKGFMGGDAGEQAPPGNAYDTKSPALSVISLSGGVGRTSLVATLGRALSSLGETVLLADTNTHGLLPYYFGARDLRPGTVRTFTPPPGSADAPVLLVSYEADGLAADEPAQNRILDDLQHRSEGIQRVLLDLNSSHLWIAQRMARLNPWILVPITPDMNSVLGAHTVERLFADVVDAKGRPVKPFYVLNQFDPALPLHLDVREVLRQFLGERLLPIMIHRAHVIPEALAEGMTVIDYAPESPATEDFFKLAAWLRKLFAPVATHVHVARWSER